jgi:hypothetical protein
MMMRSFRHANLRGKRDAPLGTVHIKNTPIAIDGLAKALPCIET